MKIMKWEVEQKKATYILRYYLPSEPIYDYKTSCRRMDDLIRYCQQCEISAVMLYVDLNPYWYYMPDNIEHTRRVVKVVKILAEKLHKHFISYQLNYQNLIGAWDGGADLRYVNNWENYVDEMGIESNGCACSAGERFRQIAGEKLRLWANTKPDVIWIDDDIRFHNHRTSVGDLWAGRITTERLDFGCFCENHIEIFNKKAQTSYSRSEILQGILSGEHKNEMRKKWFTFSGECADELAEWIEVNVHSVSPETKIAIMTSIPDIHSVEGRNWNRFLKKLSGNEKPLIRPTFGPYMENNPRDFFYCYSMPEQLKANIKSQYEKEFDFCPEIENSRFTRWSKSIAATGYQIMLSAFLGCKGVTLSIFDLEGCVLEEEPEYARLLREKRTFADNLAKMNLWDWDSHGIGLLTSPERLCAPCNQKKANEMNQLAKGRFWDEVLLKAGIACRYIVPEQICKCNGVALDAYTVNLLTDSEILQLLSKGLLLDVGAAQVLSSRGFAKEIGVILGNKVTCIAASEVLHGYKHTDGSAVRIPARIEGGKWNEIILDGAEIISTLITPYGTDYPGMTRFKNRLGGIVYIYAGNGALGDAFYTNYRVKLLKDICRDISEKKIYKMNNVSYALMAVKYRDHEAAIFVANLNADTMTDIIIEAPYKISEAVIIDADGKEHTAETDENKIYCGDMSLNIYSALVCKVKQK